MFSIDKNFRAERVELTYEQILDKYKSKGHTGFILKERRIMKVRMSNVN